MAQSDQQPATAPTASTTRAREMQRVTWASVAVNLLITVVQLVIGWIGHSQSLIAHGLHSFSDMLSDFLVIYATRHSANPADEAHPYGHARIETAATLTLGVTLALIGGGILWDSALRLQNLDTLQTAEISAFWAAVATVVVKEGLYHYLKAAGQRLRSQLLLANALHTRADSISALVVVVGIGGALLGWGFLDLVAAALMGLLILRMGVELSWGAIKELIDTGLDEASVAAIRQSLLLTPGVLGLHDVRTRRMAHQALVDAHILVDSRISVSEGHRIAEAARACVLREHPDVLDVLVHIDPENDEQPLAGRADLPDRAAVLAALAPLLAGLPEPKRIVLHYLGGGIEVEVFVDYARMVGGLALAQAEALLAERLAGHPAIRSIHLNACIAP